MHITGKIPILTFQVFDINDVGRAKGPKGPGTASQSGPDCEMSPFSESEPFTQQAA